MEVQEYYNILKKLGIYEEFIEAVKTCPDSFYNNKNISERLNIYVNKNKTLKENMDSVIERCGRYTIFRAFTWIKTPQGGDYWVDMDKKFSIECYKKENNR